MGWRRGERIGRYRLIERVGRGSMGLVFHARNERSGEEVALKLLSPIHAMDPKRRRRFEREARAMAATDHPGVVKLLSVESVNGARFLTEEFVHGETLAARLARGPLPPEELLPLGARLADALAAAHRRGIVHRDLSMTNVMVTRSGLPKVLDFGLAWMRDPSASGSRSTNLTTRGHAMGTLPFMAPEQARGRSVDARTDVFSLGSLLYQLLTGVSPFERPRPIEVLTAILFEPPVPILERDPGLPRELWPVLERCLRKDPARRYACCETLRERLLELLAQTCPAASPRADRGRDQGSSQRCGPLAG